MTKKRLLSLFTALLLGICTVSAQTEQMDSILSIETDTAYLHTIVRDASVYKARLLGRLRLLEEIENSHPGKFNEEAVVPHIKEIILRRSGKLTAFFYLKKADMLQAHREGQTAGTSQNVKAQQTATPQNPASTQPSAAPPASVDFAFTQESEVKAPRQKVEKTITALLNALNEAYRHNAPPYLEGIDMTPDCHQSMMMGWRHKPYYCREMHNVKPCLYASDNMNVRDIPVFSPNDEEHDRQLSISFNKQGQIECVRFAAELASYKKIMQNGGKEITDASDIARRTSILSFVENYRNYYINMDVEKIKNVFADDAIIITGSVITKAVKQADSKKVVMEKKVRYNRKSKEEYISSLKTLFDKQQEVNVIFDDIKVVQDPYKKDIYGVTLVQHWKSRNKHDKTYSDVGYLFLLWDFQDPEKPMIHVRTWQPKDIVKTEDDIFSLNSFRY